MVDLAKPVELTTSFRRMILKIAPSTDMYRTGTKLRILSDLYSSLRIANTRLSASLPHSLTLS